MIRVYPFNFFWRKECVRVMEITVGWAVRKLFSRTRYSTRGSVFMGYCVSALALCIYTILIRRQVAWSGAKVYRRPTSPEDVYRSTGESHEYNELGTDENQHGMESRGRKGAVLPIFDLLVLQMQCDSIMRWWEIIKRVNTMPIHSNSSSIVTQKLITMPLNR